MREQGRCRMVYRRSGYGVEANVCEIWIVYWRGMPTIRDVHLEMEFIGEPADYQWTVENVFGKDRFGFLVLGETVSC